jgi:HSP20 family protein
MLPAEVNSEQITAELAEGILTVRVPKSEAAKPRRSRSQPGEPT